MNGAKDATEQERQMGLLKAMKTYRKAIGWSIVASTALVMEGYDVVVRSWVQVWCATELILI